MDLSALFSEPQVLLPLVVIFYTLLFVLKAFTHKGKLGVNTIKVNARIYLDNHHYHIVNNLVLPGLEKTAKIDSLIVSRYGIFVIKTINREGTIIGDPAKQQWTQQRKRRSHAFPNPLVQNDQHLQALAQILDLPVDRLFSLIVFVGESRFQTPMPDNVALDKGFIKFIQQQTLIRLTEPQISQCLETIEKECLPVSRH